MRRSAAERLLDACRGALLVGASLAAATFSAFAFWPEAVDRCEAWMRARWTARSDRLEAEAASARASRDGAREAAALEQLVEALGPVRQLDVVRPRAVAAWTRLVALRRAEGDAPRVLAGLRALHAIDPRSLLLTRALAQQLLADPSTRAEAYRLLLGDPAVFGSGVAWQLPSHSEAVAPLVTALAEDARVEEARDTLAAALAWPEPAWWSVYWHSAELDPMQVASGQPRRRADGSLEWTFRVQDPVKALRVLPPAFASFVMRSPSWSVRPPGQLEFAPLATRLVATENAIATDSAVELDGSADPVLVFEFADALPQAGHELRFTAGHEDRAPAWVHRLLLGEHGKKLVVGDAPAAKALAAVRADAFSSLAVECFWATAEDDYSAERRLRAPVLATRDDQGGARFSVDAALPADWRHVRVDLGAGERLTWDFTVAELRGEDGSVVALDLKAAGLHDARRDGDSVVATGEDAQIRARRPAGSAGKATLRLEGRMR